MDIRAILRMDIGFYMGIILMPSYYSPYIGSMSFWSSSDIDRSSYGILVKGPLSSI